MVQFLLWSAGDQTQPRAIISDIDNNARFM